MKTYIEKASDNNITCMANSKGLSYIQCSLLTHGIEVFSHLLKQGEKLSLRSFATRIAQNYSDNNPRVQSVIQSFQAAELI